MLSGMQDDGVVMARRVMGVCAATVAEAVVLFMRELILSACVL